MTSLPEVAFNATSLPEHADDVAPCSEVRPRAQPPLAAIERAAELLLRGEERAAEPLLREIVERSRRAGASARDLQASLFAGALLGGPGRRPRGEANLYLQPHERPQSELFALIARAFPLVTVAGRVANELLARHLAGRDRVTLLDVGIGTGRQEVALLEQLAASGSLPRALTVVGVEPAAEPLAQAGAAITEAAERLGVRLRFAPIQERVERLSDADWQALARHEGSLVVNEAFAIHHVPGSGAGDPKDAVLRRVRALGPEAFVLTEPSVDHQTADPIQRLRNAFRHYGLVFDVIDELGLSRDEGDALKRLFFGREIEDVLATPEDERCERHESAAMWLDRLERAGFRRAGDFGAVARNDGGVVEIADHGGYLSLDHRGEPVVAVMYARG